MATISDEMMAMMAKMPKKMSRPGMRSMQERIAREQGMPMKEAGMMLSKKMSAKKKSPMMKARGRKGGK